MTIIPNRYYIPEGYSPRISAPIFHPDAPFSCHVCRELVMMLYRYEYHQIKHDIWVCENCHKTGINKHQLPVGYFPRVSGAILCLQDNPKSCDVCSNSVYTLFGYEHLDRTNNPDILVCDTCRVENAKGEQAVLDGR